MNVSTEFHTFIRMYKFSSHIDTTSFLFFSAEQVIIHSHDVAETSARLQLNEHFCTVVCSTRRPLPVTSCTQETAVTI